MVKFIRGYEGIYIGVILQVHYSQWIAQLDTLGDTKKSYAPGNTEKPLIDIIAWLLCISVTIYVDRKVCAFLPNKY